MTQKATVPTTDQIALTFLSEQTAPLRNDLLLDRLAHLAISIFQASSALIVVHDSEGHLIESTVGFPFRLNQCQIRTLSQTFYTHTHTAEVFSILDINASKSIDILPLAQELGICSVLGITLEQISPAIYGILCVFTRRPHKWTSTNKKMIRELATTVLAEISMHRKLVMQRQIAELLHEREVHYQLLFASNPNPMWIYEIATLRFLAVNTMAIQEYGYAREEFLGMTIRDIRPTEDIPILNQQLAQQPTAIFHSKTHRHRRKDGQIINVEIFSHPITYEGRAARLVMSRDLTEQKQMEARFLQMQKMEGVGRLAGGVAHDFNNLLTIISGYVDLALDTIEPASPLREDLSEIQHACTRAATLTRQLLAFTRRQIISLQILDLNELIINMDKLLRRLIGEDIELVTLPGTDIGLIKADPHQIEQIIVNMAVNARDAMPAGGKLIIETSHIELDTSYAATHGGAGSGSYVMLAISDNGVGMSAEVKEHLFEPFFTTKDQDRGTGLGLATSFDIITQHEGHVWVYSEEDQGSIFKIYFPLVEDSTTLTSGYHEAMVLPRGTETILLAEDEPLVLDLAARVLRAQGYTVLEATNGSEALQIMHNAQPDSINLLLTDIVMPQMNGPTLAQQVQQICALIKVLFISGYTDSAITHHGRLKPGVSFLQKPFSTAALVHKVRNVLDS